MKRECTSWRDLAEISKNFSIKSQWEEVFNTYKNEVIQFQFDLKSIKTIFSRLKKDKNSLNYNPYIWLELIEACINARSLDFAEELCQFCKTTTNVPLLYRIGLFYLDKNLSGQSKKIANRTLKFKNLSKVFELKFLLLIANCYMSENNIVKAKKIHEKILELDSDLNSSLNGEHLFQFARLYFFLGDYVLASSFFQKAAKSFQIDQNYLNVCRSHFNSAACLDNQYNRYITNFAVSPIDTNEMNTLQDECDTQIKLCMKIAKKYNFEIIHQSSLNFYGVKISNNGSLVEALDYFQRAESMQMELDTSFQCLHNLAMQVEVLLNLGSIQKAQKKWDQLSQLLIKKETVQYKDKYLKLNSQILWESGQFFESFSMLVNYLNDIVPQVEESLERRQLLSEFMQQAFLLGKLPIQKFRDDSINQILKKHFKQLLSSRFVLNVEANKYFQFIFDSNKEFLNIEQINSPNGSIATINLITQILTSLIHLDSHAKIFHKIYMERLKKDDTQVGQNKFNYAYDFFSATFFFKNNNITDGLDALKRCKKIKNIPIHIELICKHVLSKFSNISYHFQSKEEMLIKNLVNIYFPTLVQN